MLLNMVAGYGGCVCGPPFLPIDEQRRVPPYVVSLRGCTFAPRSTMNHCGSNEPGPVPPDLHAVVAQPSVILCGPNSFPTSPP